MDLYLFESGSSKTSVYLIALEGDKEVVKEFVLPGYNPNRPNADFEAHLQAFSFDEYFFLLLAQALLWSPREVSSDKNLSINFAFSPRYEYSSAFLGSLLLLKVWIHYSDVSIYFMHKLWYKKCD